LDNYNGWHWFINCILHTVNPSNQFSLARVTIEAQEWVWILHINHRFCANPYYWYLTRLICYQIDHLFFKLVYITYLNTRVNVRSCIKIYRHKCVFSQKKATHTIYIYTYIHTCYFEWNLVDQFIYHASHVTNEVVWRIIK
jgi:hypothetical protein